MWVKDLLSKDRPKEGCFFADNKKRVDYVIVLKAGSTLDGLFIYIQNLEHLGLEFEVVDGQTVDKKFILIHLPQKANKHFAEVYTVGIEENRTFNFEKPIWFSKVFTTPISIIPFKKKGEFTSAERIIIINKLLEETMYGEDIIQKGISELIRVNLVETAYPLHDGYLHYDPLMYNNDRQLLYHHWATLSNWYKEVPIDMIHRYFGCQIAFYFAWLEYFNYRLILVAILGSLVVITNYILVTSVPINQIDEICDQHNMWICPKCQFSEQCTFVPLSAYCSYAQYNYVFDNYVTVGFAIFMTFWATSFVHSWRRKENRLKLRWDVQYQNPVLAVRQQYLDAAKGNRLNRVTGNLEPYVAKHIRYLGMAVSVSICLFAIFLIVGVVCGTILLDVMLETSMDSNPVLYFRKKSTIPYMVSGCLMNVIFIKLFSKVYGRLSIWLTNLEIPRTQTDYDKSFLYKKYFLSFVNNYLNFFYLAFLRGRLYTLPNRYKYFSLIERDTCQPLNCIFVIWIWMSFLLMLKTFAINVVKILIQNLGSCIGKLRGKLETSYEGVPQYEADFMLKTTDQFLITTYFNDMVIAYGHTTLFVAAFPLAPLCVLLNNILEVRMQAHSLITECRRPTPKVREGIGAWNGIITGVTFFSTVTNAFVIAFTSSFIEREIYQFTVKSDLEGYVNSTLAKFATKDYNFNFTREGHYDPIICYFKAHRFPPDHPDRYELTSDHWTELTWKLISVLIFEHIILVCNIFFAYMIPDMPRAVRIQQKLDRTLAKEARARLYYGRRWRRSSRAPRRGTSVETPSFKSHSISSAMGLKLY